MLSMNDNPFGDFESDPIFNTALGAIMLLDNLFRLCSGYLLGNEPDKYYSTLEAIYIELTYWIEQQPLKKISLEDKANLEKIRTSARSLGIETLKIYHIKLNKYANMCGLRLKSDARLPGVIGGK